MDSIPVVAITANVPDNLIGRDAFQEVCITGVTMPITKHNFFVNRIEDLEHSLREAFRIANSGRKGPVLVDITKDVTAAKADYTPKKPAAIKKVTDTIKADTIPSEPCVFNNVPLDSMLTTIAAAHGVQVKFENDAVRELRFHFVWKRKDSLARVVEKLNTFEAVNIAQEDKKLVVR